MGPEDTDAAPFGWTAGPSAQGPAQIQAKYRAKLIQWQRRAGNIPAAPEQQAAVQK